MTLALERIEQLEAELVMARNDAAVAKQRSQEQEATSQAASSHASDLIAELTARASALAEELAKVRAAAEAQTAEWLDRLNRTASEHAAEIALLKGEAQQRSVDAQGQIVALSQELGAAKSEIATLRESETELQARLTRTESSVSEFQGLAAKEQARSTSLERELANARAAIEVERKRAEEADDPSCLAPNNCLSAADALTQERSRTATLETELLQSRAELERLRAETSEKIRESDALAAELQEQKDRMNDLRQRTEGLDRELAAAKQDAETLRANLTALHTDAASAQDADLRKLQELEAGREEQRRLSVQERDRADMLARDAEQTAQNLAAERSASAADKERAEHAETELKLARNEVETLRVEIASLTAEVERARTNFPRVATQSAPAPLPPPDAPARTEASEPPVGGKTEAPAVPAKPAAPPVNEARLMARADDFIHRGDISGARLMLDRALNEGSALAAFRLAETYDPRVLAQWKAHGTTGDPDRARQLYSRALAAGFEPAKERLH